MYNIELTLSYFEEKFDYVLESHTPHVTYVLGIQYREIFDPTRVHSGEGTYGFIEVPIPPKTRGPSRSWGHGRVLDRALLRELRAARLFVEAEVKRLWPRRRGRKRRRFAY